MDKSQDFWNLDTENDDLADAQIREAEILDPFEAGAPERLDEFNELVNKEGYFLGIHKDAKENIHLVLTRNNPDGTSQDAVFIFPVVNTSMEKIFIAPGGINKIIVHPVKNGGLYLNIEDVMYFFKKAKEKFSAKKEGNMSEEKIREIINKLVDLFVNKKDVLITKTDGTEVLVTGGSLNIFGDPILGRTKDGANVRIARSDIADAVAA